MPSPNQRRKSKADPSMDELVKQIESIRSRSADIMKQMKALQDTMDAVAEEQRARHENRRK